MMGQKLIDYARNRNVLAKPLKDYISKDHLLVKIDAVDFSFIYEEVKGLYAQYGSDSIDPVVVFKMFLIGYLYDIPSERKIVEAINENLAYRYFLGYALDEDIPYRTNFTRIRKRWGEDVFRRIFNKIVGMCINAGLVGKKSASIDSTNVKAHGPVEVDKLYRENKVKEYLDDISKANYKEVNIEELRKIKSKSIYKRKNKSKKKFITST